VRQKAWFWLKSSEKTFALWDVRKGNERAKEQHFDFFVFEDKSQEFVKRARLTAATYPIFQDWLWGGWQHPWKAGSSAHMAPWWHVGFFLCE
jgi:hypothetical protein